MVVAERIPEFIGTLANSTASAAKAIEDLAVLNDYAAFAAEMDLAAADRRRAQERLVCIANDLSRG
jgi:hypothetical protein